MTKEQLKAKINALNIGDSRALEKTKGALKEILNEIVSGSEPYIYDGEVTIYDSDAYTHAVAIVPANIYQEMKEAFASGKPTLLKTGNTAGDYLAIAWSPDAVTREETGDSIEGLIVSTMSDGAIVNVPVNVIISEQPA